MTASRLSTCESGLAGKQDLLTFDDAPTEGSSNPVTSGGVYTAINSSSSSSFDTLYTGTLQSLFTTTKDSFSITRAFEIEYIYEADGYKYHSVRSRVTPQEITWGNTTGTKFVELGGAALISRAGSNRILIYNVDVELRSTGTISNLRVYRGEIPLTSHSVSSTFDATQLTTMSIPIGSSAQSHLYYRLWV